MVTLIQPHCCLGLHIVFHGYVSTEAKQIAKQSLYLWILFRYLTVLLNMYIISLRSIQTPMSLGWQTHLYSFLFLSSYICRGNLKRIVSPSLWFNFWRFYPHWQPRSDTRSLHCSVSECFMRFHNYYKQHPIPCKLFLCPRYSWHGILFFF